MFRTLDFSILSYDPSSMNQLDMTSAGMIYLPANQPISYEDHENVTLFITVTDNGGSCGGGACNELNLTVFVQIVNQNQFTPVITQSTSPHLVNESVSVGDVVTMLVGSDQDNGQDGWKLYIIL